jgi:hypothetical protein
MRHRALVACTLSVGLLVCAPAWAAAKVDFLAIQRELVADSQRYLANEKLEVDWDRRLRDVEVTEETVDEYQQGLLQPVPFEPGPFVVAHYLRPLLRSEKEIIEKLLPAVDRVYTRYARWTPLPQLNSSAKRQIGVPDHNPRENDAAAMRKLMDQIRRRNQALQTYEKVRLHNVQVERLMEYYTKLKIRSGDPRASREIIQLIRQLENQGLKTWANIVSTIGDESKHLNKDRAKPYYDLFTEIGQRFRLESKSYADPTAVAMKKSGEASFGDDKVNVGQSFLEAADDLAKKHDLPNVDVPSRRELREHQRKLREERRRQRRRGRNR